MSQFPRLRLALPVLLAAVLAASAVAAHAHGLPEWPAAGIHDQGSLPSQGDSSPEGGLAGLSDDPSDLDGVTASSGLPCLAIATAAIVGREWRGGFRYYVNPFKRGPPAA